VSPTMASVSFPRRATMTSGRRAAVIGSGFGGLASAIRLQSMGFDTVCYEAHDQPGGRACVYEDGGYVFDAGPTVITPLTVWRNCSSSPEGDCRTTCDSCR